MGSQPNAEASSSASKVSSVPAVASIKNDAAEQQPRKRVTSLRSAQIPRDATISEHAPAASAVQILAARYSANANKDSAPTGMAASSASSSSSAATPTAAPSNSSSTPGAPISIEVHPPKNPRRMSTPAISPSMASPSAIPRLQHPPSAALTRPVRRRREAGSLDLAASRANSNASLLPPSPSPTNSTPNGSTTHEFPAGPAPSSSAASSSSTPAGALSNENGPHDSNLLPTDGEADSLAELRSQPSQAHGRAPSPSPSIASTRSYSNTSAAPSGRVRRISTPADAPSFAQPTQASEQRRLANMTQLVNVLLARNSGGSTTSMDDPAHPSRANSNTAPGAMKETTSTKVINALTTELDAVRATLESTTSQLAQAQKSLSALERDRDSLRDSVHRARTESDTLASQLQRKDRALTDALERARRAEAESREHGRQGREWGARVRAVEDELGQERREKARAEAAYEAVALEWKRTRESWKVEMEAIRADLTKRQEKDRAEMEDLRQRVTEVSLLGRAMAAGKEGDDSTGKENEDVLAPFRRVLQGLENERLKMETWAQTHIDTIVEQVETEQAQRASVEAGLEEVRRELTRILRLARAGSAQ
ncbi:hypothetical protein OC846_002889 [Tilletia horrida]|uniref:SWI5-dependent HO expression protein 3 n=1 Tax=Tilletia horrida TaxID=155126 RepID=A0AAN6GT88_9BASI|nr:hypothetical protein OC845_002083 [Tilletia horrida]KAK0552485.1 hypothetical protein OC846_002889 [Tilletia horrida]KAK0561787.1 hypothetical protein OC861_005653 [Tilletia horrida]